MNVRNFYEVHKTELEDVIAKAVHNNYVKKIKDVYVDKKNKIICGDVIMRDNTVRKVFYRDATEKDISIGKEADPEFIRLEDFFKKYVLKKRIKGINIEVAKGNILVAECFITPDKILYPSLEIIIAIDSIDYGKWKEEWKKTNEEFFSFRQMLIDKYFLSEDYDL